MTGQGAMAPIAGHTGTGHQAQRTAVDLTDVDGVDVVTDFHPDSETSRTLLYGSNFVEIQPSTTGSKLGSSQTFTFSNDVDAIGDMYARIVLELTPAGNATNVAEFPALALARIIDRVEVMVGNSTWQTMENSDVVAMAATMLSKNAYHILDTQARGYQVENNALVYRGHGQKFTGTAKKYECWLPLYTFTSGGPARAHLVAGAPHQSVRVKLTYADESVIGANMTTTSTVGDLSVQLWNRQHIMTNAEREQIRNNTVAKTIRLTQHAEQVASGDTTVNVELDSFSLLASHLLICTEGADDSAGATNQHFISEAELLLNTSSHSGKLSGAFMRSLAGNSMGLQTNFTPQDPDSSDVGSEKRRDFYVFPIASTPYGADGCPMNRFDTIRLKLTGRFAGKVHVTCVGTTTAVYKNQAASVLYFS